MSASEDFSSLNEAITGSYSGCDLVNTSDGWLHTLRRYCSACEEKRGR